MQVDIIDTPGHASFVKNMSVGASLGDCVVIVLSAAKGEFEAAWGTGKNTQQEILIAIAQGVRCDFSWGQALREWSLTVCLLQRLHFCHQQDGYVQG